MASIRKTLRRLLPPRTRFSEDRALRGVFGRVLGDYNLWLLNRRSVAWAFAIGLLMAWVPVPFQMLLAAGGAILMRCNLAIAVVTVWLTNPITMGPMFYGAYRLGIWILTIPRQPFRIELSWEWLRSGLSATWEPFLLGCAVLGVTTAIAGYFLVHLIWRLHVVRSWSARTTQRRGEK